MIRSTRRRASTSLPASAPSTMPRSRIRRAAHRAARQARAPAQVWCSSGLCRRVGRLHARTGDNVFPTCLQRRARGAGRRARGDPQDPALPGAGGLGLSQHAMGGVDDHGSALSVEQIVELYAARWKIEAGFREIKQEIGSAATQTRCPNAVSNHLHFCMVATTLTWIYAALLDQAPPRRYASQRTTEYAFADGDALCPSTSPRRVLVPVALSQPRGLP